MSWLLEMWDEFLDWLPVLAGLAGFVVTGAFVTWVLMTKRNSTSAVAWILIIVFLPFAGAAMFVLFGYQHVGRPLQRKRRHKSRYTLPPYPHGHESTSGSFARVPAQPTGELSVAQRLNLLANRFGAYPLTVGNHVDFYFDGPPAFAAMLEAIRGARHHVHVEFFIFHADVLGTEFLIALAEKARQGVEVRLLYDAMGSHKLPLRSLSALRAAGGKTSVFLPISLLRRRIQVNMRNHRKILVVDGEVGFSGGLNVGDEYMGRVPFFGYWRDTHLRLRGPAVGDLQRVFAEDWDFASGEPLVDLSDQEPRYFKAKDAGGPYPVQVIESGPDRDLKAIREMYFAAILKARERVWIASPYFVPDPGMLDALRLAAHLGVDVRFLGQFHPDKWIPQFAARYYWNEVLPAGVKIYQYAKGMMHSKVVLVDGQWASVGTANLDNRSLYLNFEVNCMIYSPQAVSILEEAFLRDLQDSIRVDRGVFARRPFSARLLENACRLLSPIL
jgi:cardiolipin synthase A/B